MRLCARDFPTARRSAREHPLFWITPLALACAGVLGTVAAEAADMQGPAAGDAPAASLDEVVVTAQKRVSTLQDAPISISALSGDELSARGVASLAALAQATPGVSLKSEGPSQTEIEMRGLSSSGGNSGTVGFYLDDVPLAGPANAQNGHVVIDPDLYDLQRIEVLRGPQGTLSGSGSMGGTVRLLSNAADLSGFQASAQSVLSATQGGGFNHKDNLMLNLPLIDDTLALRVVGTESRTSGWIDRIVADPFPLAGGTPNGVTRGDVAAAPVQARIGDSNAYQLYAARVTLRWHPSEPLTVTPAFLYTGSTQNGISAYDSNPATLTHYQPFDIAEPLTDSLAVYSLNISYRWPALVLTSNTAWWTRSSSQVEEASEAFNNPLEGISESANEGLPNPGYYGVGGTGPERGLEVDSTHQLSEELRLNATGEGRLSGVAGLYFSNYYSRWTFQGVTPNASSFMDLGSLAPATTTLWFAANSPTRIAQFAAFGDLTYALTDAFKAALGARVTRDDYRYSSCIEGYGSGLGAATPSCTGQIALGTTSVDPKLTLSYRFDPERMVYATFATGFRPGGANPAYPTTGAAWGTAFQQAGYRGDQWPSTYGPDRVLSYELGGKNRFLEQRVTLDASLYYEDWRHVQLEAYPNDWALNINGNKARIWGADIDALADLGLGFQVQLAAGYLNEWLNGGPHWIIQPVHQMPDVAPENATLALNYAKPLWGALRFSARIESAYTGPRYSIFFSDPFEFSGTYRQLPGYDLVNLRAGIAQGGRWSATLFVNNATNRHAQLESMFTENEPQPSFTRLETNQPLTGGIDLNCRF